MENRTDLLSDQHITDINDDEFKRDDFIEAITKVILDQSTDVNPNKQKGLAEKEDNLIIGINGQWGSGKSSVLAILEKQLKNKLLVHWFNPWMYNSEEDLIINLFNTVLDDPKLSKGKNLKRVNKLTSSLLSNLNFGTPLSTSASIVGKVMSTFKFEKHKTTQQLKKELEDYLLETANPVVILVDDVDRLSKDEIKTLFKTLRLIGSFKHVTYVVAFDEEMVAKSIKESYADGTIEDGRAFIEKIIQLPIRVPAIEPNDLFEFTKKLIKDYEIEIPDIISKFIFYRCVSTPRDVKRVVNSFKFLEKLNQGNIDNSDLFLLELFRINLPHFFEFFILLFEALNNADPDKYFYTHSKMIFKAYYPEVFDKTGVNIVTSQLTFWELSNVFKILTGINITSFEGYNENNSNKTLNKISNHEKLKEYFKLIKSAGIDPENLTLEHETKQHP